MTRTSMPSSMASPASPPRAPQHHRPTLDHLSCADSMCRFAHACLLGGSRPGIVVALSFGLFGQRRRRASLYIVRGPQRARGPQRRADRPVHRTVCTLGFIVAVATADASRPSCVCVIAGMEPTRAFLNAPVGMATSGFVHRRLRAHAARPSCTTIPSPSKCDAHAPHDYRAPSASCMHAELWKGRPLPVYFRDIEIRSRWCIWIAVMAFVFAATLSPSSALSMTLLALMRRGRVPDRLGVHHHGLPGRHHQPAHHIADFSNGALPVIAWRSSCAVGGGCRLHGRRHQVQRAWASSSSRIVATREGDASAPDSARVVVSYNHLGRRILDAGSGASRP